MVLCDKNDNQEELVELATQIFKDYINEGADYELGDNQIVLQLRPGFDHELN